MDAMRRTARAAASVRGATIAMGGLMAKSYWFLASYLAAAVGSQEALRWFRRREAAALAGRAVRS